MHPERQRRDTGVPSSDRSIAGSGDDRRRADTRPTPRRETEPRPCHDARLLTEGGAEAEIPARRGPLRPAHHAAGQAHPDQMSRQPRHPGGAAVGRLDDLPPLERQVIRCLRLWCSGPEGRSAVRWELASQRAMPPPTASPPTSASCSQLTAGHARRPLIGHALDCPCAGGDECVFARFVALAAEGAREEAVLMAALIVRADLALGLAALAEGVGLGLMRGHAPRVYQ